MDTTAVHQMILEHMRGGVLSIDLKGRVTTFNPAAGKLLGLEREAQRFHPYSTNPDAPPIDQRLARELSNTLDSILLYEQNLARLNGEQDQLASKFAADIERFAKLTSLN